MNMGERIKQLRKEKGLTQEELGKYIGVKKAAIMKYEKGNVKNMKRSSIETLSKLFGVTPSYLMCLNEDETTDITNSHKIYMMAVYGQISAGQPNWAEECIEGRLPIDPNMMNIVDPEECFFLRVNGESMNKVIKNGAYALIRKQDYAEEGDIVVAIVNGDNEATLKRFKRFNEQFVSFEPMSSDESFKPINVDLKNTNVIILGKYIGKFEMK